MANQTMEKAHRGTIFLESAQVVSNDAHDGGQFILRISAPKLAAAAEPGNFAHIRCSEDLPMRRPMSVMRASPNEGWAEFLFKLTGAGTRRLATLEPGAAVSVLGPIGTPFTPSEYRSRALLIGGGVGIPPMVFLCDALRRRPTFKPFVIMGSEVPFPFRQRPSQILVPGIPPGVIGCMPLLDDWGIPSRLASLAGYAGCFDGYVTDLAASWLDKLTPAQRADVEIFACGPTPMLRATQALATQFGVISQLCLEEYMACAVGGCAGCVVRTRTENGPAMKRVCVDGPVFDGATVVWDASG